jgi:hypothetical protein
MRRQRQQCRADAHQKDLAGDELRQPAIAALGEHGLDARARQQSRRGCVARNR